MHGTFIERFEEFFSGSIKTPSANRMPSNKFAIILDFQPTEKAAINPTMRSTSWRVLPK
jgi:hypothetical protein